VVQGDFMSKEIMYFIYVLQSEKDNKFYIGFTGDVDRRIKDHNEGKNLSTKNRRPFKVLYYEAHTSKHDALRRELYFKTAKGKASFRQILREALK
jgi:putative endonuclease